MQTDLTAYVPNVHFEQIPIKNLVSNQDYQRNLSLKHVQKAAANFNLYQINPVKVSRRDGINYVSMKKIATGLLSSRCYHFSEILRSHHKITSCYSHNSIWLYLQ